MSNNNTTVSSASIEIDAPVDRVRGALTDPTRIADFHPLVRASRAGTDPDADRECEFVPMGLARERVSWSGDELVAEFVSGRRMPPIEAMTGKLALCALGERTRVSFELRYRMRPGLIPALVNAMMVRPQFTRAPSFYVAGLKHLVERGRKATAADLKALGWTDV